MTGALLVLWLASGIPHVSGDSTCPTPDEVRERLASLDSLSHLSASFADEVAAKSSLNRVTISSSGPGVHIELHGPEGRLVAERTLERTGPCSDLAEAAAVIVSTWHAEFNPNLTTSVVRPPQPLPREPASIAGIAAKPQPSRQVPFDVGLAVLTSIAGGQTAVGAKLEACLFATKIPLGLDMGLTATFMHTQAVALPETSAKWARTGWSAGPAYRLRRGPSLLDIHAGGVVALLRVQGAGFLPSLSDTSPQLGIQAGLRGMWTWKKVAGWIGSDATWYPGKDRLIVDDYGDVGGLPRWDVHVAVGFSLGRFL